MPPCYIIQYNIVYYLLYYIILLGNLATFWIVLSYILPPPPVRTVHVPRVHRLRLLRIFESRFLGGSLWT